MYDGKVLELLQSIAVKMNCSVAEVLRKGAVLMDKAVQEAEKHERP